MLDQFLNTAAGELLGQLTSKTQLDESQARQSVDIARGVVTDQVRKEAMGGNLSGLLDLLKGQQTAGSSPILAQISSTLVNQLIGKLGLPDNVAKQISQVAIPFLMERISQQTPADLDQSQLGKMLTDTMMRNLGAQFKKGMGGFFG